MYRFICTFCCITFCIGSYGQNIRLSNMHYLTKLDSICLEYSKHADSVFLILKSTPVTGFDSCYVLIREKNKMETYLYSNPIFRPVKICSSFENVFGVYKYYKAECIDSQMFSHMPQFFYKIYNRNAVIVDENCVIGLDTFIKPPGSCDKQKKEQLLILKVQFVFIAPSFKEQHFAD